MRGPSSTHVGCLPLDSAQLAVVLTTSLGLDGSSLLAPDAADTLAGCDRLAVAGWAPIYVLTRLPNIDSLFAEESEVLKVVLGRSVRNTVLGSRAVPQPLRRLLLCAPASCAESREDISALADVLAERTLPMLQQPARLASAGKLLFAQLLANLSHLRSDQLDAGASNGRELVPCRTGACDTLWRSIGSELPADALVVVDVGAHKRSGFMDWLGPIAAAIGNQTRSQHNWLIAIEPHPNLVPSHPDHPRLALLEAAVGITSDHHVQHAPFHTAEFDMCSSLMPLPGREHAINHGLSEFIGNCMAKSSEEDASVQVPVVSMALVLDSLPPSQEVLLLKIDAQGSDLDVLKSAGAELRRVQRIVAEVQDLPRGHPGLLYGPSQPVKEDVVIFLATRGFILDSCRSNTEEVLEEDCFFVRDNLLRGPDAGDHGYFPWVGVNFGPFHV